MTRPRDRLAFAPDVVFQLIGEDALLLKLDTEVVFSLNATGARVAELIGRHSRAEAIVAALAEEYGLSREAIAPDVTALLDALAARELITWRPSEDP
ncbi:MAG: PqqD family protein [Acidobacteria bacterium]|nr:PqqD family protein [Acidobacteriota bacterium]